MSRITMLYKYGKRTRDILERIYFIIFYFILVFYVLVEG